MIDHLPFDVFRVNLANGHRELFKKIGPADPDGVLRFPSVVFTPNSKYYAYTYNRILTELYTVRGLR